MAKKPFKKTNTGRFAGVPVAVMNTSQYINLKNNEKALLFELALQYNGNNNGNLTTAESILGKRGWARASIYRAHAGLVHAGFVVVTRQGVKVRGYPTLLALTYQPIDEPPAGIVYDKGIKPSNAVSLGYWCKTKESWDIQPTVKDPCENSQKKPLQSISSAPY